MKIFSPKIFKTASLLFLVFVGMGGICKDTHCALPDLAVNLIVPSGTILAGEPFNISGTVTNLPDLDLDCTELANKSNSAYNLYYSNTQDDPWVQESSSIIIVDILDSGRSQQDDLTLVFNAPGYYLIESICDESHEVSERSESNNDVAIERNGSNNDVIKNPKMNKNLSNNIWRSEVIIVLPNPNIPIDTSKPNIELKSVRRIF